MQKRLNTLVTSMEGNMKLIDDKNQPELIGLITEVDDLTEMSKMVNVLNKDLVDSGFDQYQYKTVQRGNKIYIERIEA